MLDLGAGLFSSLRDWANGTIKTSIGTRVGPIFHAGIVILLVLLAKYCNCRGFSCDYTRWIILETNALENSGIK